MEVSPDLLLALSRARWLWELTAGAFDATVLPALEALGYDRTFADVARDGPPVDHAPTAPGFDRVEIDAASSAVRLGPGVRIDLGGVGKGLAADLVAEGIVLRGASSALVELGGDVRTAGEVLEGGWQIPVLDPFDATSTWSHASLGSEAIVTCTSLIRRWRRGRQELHHIVDPLTGMPTDVGVVAVVARGQEAWLAEGLAKATMVVGESGANALLADTGVSAEVFRADRSSVAIGGASVLCSPI